MENNRPLSQDFNRMKILLLPILINMIGQNLIILFNF